MSDKFSLSVIIRAIDKFTGPMRKMSSAMVGASAKMRKAGKAMRTFGRDMFTRVTLPITAALGGMAWSAIQWEDAFAGVRKTVEASEPELLELEKGIRTLSKAIPVGAVELANFAMSAGQLGIETSNILGFTKVVADMGVATNLVGEQGAQQMARFANIMGMPQTEFERLGSTLVGLGNTSATTEAEIMEMALRLAGAGKQVGMNEHQVLGLSAALSSLGVEAQMGGSSLSQVMIKMSKDLSGTSKMAKKHAAVMGRVMGITATEMKKAFKKDAIGTIVKFVDKLAELEDKGVEVGNIMDAVGFQGLRLTDSIGRLRGSGDLLSRSLERGGKYWVENTALATEVERKYKTLGSQLKILKNRIHDAAITWGDEMTPSIRNEVIPVVDLLIEKLNAMDSSTRQAAIGAAGITAVLSPMIIALGWVASALGAPFLALLALVPILAFLIIKYFDKIKMALTFLVNSFSNAFMKIEEIILTKVRALFAQFPKGIWATIFGTIAGVSPAKMREASEFADRMTKGIDERLENLDAARKKLARSPFGTTLMDTLFPMEKLNIPFGAALGLDSKKATTYRLGGANDILTKSQAEILIKVASDQGSRATIESVKRSGPAELNILNQAYLGAH